MAMEGPGTTQDKSGNAVSPVPGSVAQRTSGDPSQNLSSTPIEMNPLPGSAGAGGATSQEEPQISGGLQTEPAVGETGGQADEIHEGNQTAPQNGEPQVEAFTQQSTGPRGVSPPPLNRENTVPAIGPATDKPTPLTRETTTEGPVLYITLLLASTGARHPFKLDAKYLRKRGVEVEDNNPINISLYKLKELILRDWREEWNAKPTSPDSIRLITMGKLLNDKARLADSGFTNGVTPHIVHMTVKPQDIIDEEEANKAAGKDRDGNERSPGCRCIIQ